MHYALMHIQTEKKKKMPKLSTKDAAVNNMPVFNLVG